MKQTPPIQDKPTPRCSKHLAAVIAVGAYPFSASVPFFGDRSAPCRIEIVQRRTGAVLWARDLTDAMDEARFIARREPGLAVRFHGDVDSVKAVDPELFGLVTQLWASQVCQCQNCEQVRACGSRELDDCDVRQASCSGSVVGKCCVADAQVVC